MKDLLNLLKSQGQSEEFDSIRIGLAAQVWFALGHSEKLKNLKQLTTGLLSLNEMACFVQKFWSCKRLRMFVWQVQAIKASWLFVKSVVLKLL